MGDFGHLMNDLNSADAQLYPFICVSLGEQSNKLGLMKSLHVFNEKASLALKNEDYYYHNHHHSLPSV